MKLKKFLSGIVASALALATMSSMNIFINAANETELYTKLIYDGVIEGKTVATGYEIDIDNYPCLRGVNGEKIKLTYTGDYSGTTSGTACTVAAVCPDLTTGANVSVKGQLFYTTPAEYGKENSIEVSISDFLSQAKHTAKTGTKGASATEDVHKFVVFPSTYALNSI